MNAFDLAREVENRGLDALMPFLRHKAFNGQFVLTYKGALALMLQQTVGDLLINVKRCDGVEVCAVEIKCDGTDYDNLFLETWSNRNFEPRKPGWMMTNMADSLWYYFIKRDELLIFNFRKLWNWAHCEPQRSVSGGCGRMYDFKEPPQNKFVQMNKTTGRCVPISVLAEEVGFKLFSPKRNGLKAGLLIDSAKGWRLQRFCEEVA